jgi:hypothetical protein
MEKIMIYFLLGLIVGFILTISYLIHVLFKLNNRSWNIFISGAAAGVAFLLMIERMPF